jgi:hypothetical protein
MSATLLYRIAAVVFVLFAFGHTFGFLSFRPPSQEGRAVYDSMNNVHFQVGGKSFSYGNWYRGFGLTITVSMCFGPFFHGISRDSRRASLERLAPWDGRSSRYKPWVWWLVCCTSACPQRFFLFWSQPWLVQRRGWQADD